jgi:hypothetical protein
LFFHKNLSIDMLNHRATGEEHPDFIALNELQAAAGGNYRTNLGGRRDPDDALGIKPSRLTLKFFLL